MKTLNLSIIVGVITIAILISMIPVQHFLTLDNFHVVKIQKLVDDKTMWKLIHPKNNEKEEYVVTEGMDWSDDGKLVAFGVNAGAPVSYLWTMNTTGEDMEPANIPIEFNAVSYVHVSENGNSVFFVGQYNSKNETYQDIFRYDVKNKTYLFVTRDSHVGSVGYMPDGKIIYVAGHSNATRLEKNTSIFLIKHYDVLWLADQDGQKIKPLYNGTQLFDGMTVSPDDSRIAFVSGEDPLHPSSNGTDIVNFASLGPPTANNYSYLAVFDINTREFTVVDKVTNEEFADLKWLSDDLILYETMTHHCVQDKTPGSQSCPTGLLDLMTVSSHKSQIVYGNQEEPYAAPLVGATISPDGRSLIFGINYDYSNGIIDGKGIYRIDFDKPLWQSSGS
ncbi:MAG: PD40 domain-containing protein [Thaumarchaeota archaeon]|nr:PD40 domain-containing protein [Nitrososphaerota archaeon]